MKLCDFLTKRCLYLLLIVPFLIVGCDKEGNPLPGMYKMEIQKDGINFIDEKSIILPPGAKDGPELRYTFPYPSYYYPEVQTKENLTLASSPYKKGNRKNKEFLLSLYLPMQGGVELNKKYEIKPIEGKEIIIKGETDDFNNENGQLRFRYNLDYDKTYYGTGFIIFTKYGENQNGTTIAEGSIDFSIPTDKGDRSMITGTFILPVEISY